MFDDSHSRTALSASQAWGLSGRLSEDGAPRSIMLTPLPFSIGRRTGVSLTLPRATVSSMHAEFFEQDRRLFLRDFGSTNGTFINGNRVAEAQEVRENDLVQFADAPFRVTRLPTSSRSHTRCKEAGDQALAIVQFDSLLEGTRLLPMFQPIVDLSLRQLVGFEALARSRVIGLETPDFMFHAAEQLGSTTRLSQVMRRVAVEESAALADAPHLFLNTHPQEVAAEGLLQSCAELREQAPSQRITIEIHEAAVTRLDDMVALRDGLDALGMTLAFDDFGAGQARLAELAEVRPHYLKFDRCMIRDLHRGDAARRRVIGALVAMVRDVGIVPLAEGLESAAECAVCIDLGFELGQGYLFGKPMPAAHYLKLESQAPGDPEFQELAFGSLPPARR